MHPEKKKILIFSDIDGTIIDKESYSFEESIGTVRKVIALKIPIILVSSKSFAEIEIYRHKMGIPDPFISENGGAVFIPAGYFEEESEDCIQKGNYHVRELATPLSLLVDKIQSFKECTANEIILFDELTDEELIQIAKIPADEVKYSRLRDYDLPFILKKTSSLRDEDILECAAQHHLSIIKGARFFHILLGSNKGRAVEYLIKEFSRSNQNVVSIGIGDSRNDLEMLIAVNTPVAVKKPDGTYDGEFEQKIPHLIKAKKIGPSGWSEAMNELILHTAL